MRPTMPRRLQVKQYFNHSVTSLGSAMKILYLNYKIPLCMQVNYGVSKNRCIGHEGVVGVSNIAFGPNRHSSKVVYSF